MREEGGGDGGQGGGAVGELELAEEVCHTINGRMKNSHSQKDTNGCLLLLMSSLTPEEKLRPGNWQMRERGLNRALWLFYGTCLFTFPAP